jgi:hypothetical protein
MVNPSLAGIDPFSCSMPLIGCEKKRFDVGSSFYTATQGSAQPQRGRKRGAVFGYMTFSGWVKWKRYQIARQNRVQTK